MRVRLITIMYRTHHCNALRLSHLGETITLAGWVNSTRDHGGVIFIDLRDREGLTQVVFRPEENADVAAASHSLRDEDVIQLTGTVSKRLEGTENTRLATGEIEIVATGLKILNKADVLPFPLDRELSNEDLRMKYRYLDLRRPRLNRNLRMRHAITTAARNYLDSEGFIEVETPILSNPTPEGARDFLVPARLMPGHFFALPQAPQQYKQLLQVAGLEKYFQIARCFRDEDLRADRQPEFTQIDLEASFVTAEDIYQLVEGLLVRMFKAGTGVDVSAPFPRITYQEAMDRFGSDKPDTRYGMEITDMADEFAASEFKIFKGTLDGGGVVRAINAGSWEEACTILGRVRCEIAGMLDLMKGSTALNFLWVVDFPLLAFSKEDGHWVAVHHPFTRPMAEDMALLEAGDLAKVRAVAYDVVLNGYELGGGSLRIHERDLQAKMFGVLGVTEEEQRIKFSHLLDAFRFGAPPHGGLALGLDRIAMLAAGETSIREVIAFPKNNKAADLMTDSPTEVDFKQLRELYIASTAKKKEEAAEATPRPAAGAP